MLLTWLILLLFFGGVGAWIAGYWSDRWPRWISLGVLGVHLACVSAIWADYLGQRGSATAGAWIAEVSWPWIPAWGARWQLGLDGVSLLLTVLTSVLGMVGVACSWEGVTYRVGFFHLNLLWILAAVIGVFLATDLLLFYFFWEVVLIPLYFLIAIWGHEHRIYAALKFFIFTQGSSLLMLLAILGLYFVHGRTTGHYTFDFEQLRYTPLDSVTAMWLFLGFFVAFAVKLPVVPVHTWLPDAHTEAPTAGSVDLAGLVLKLGAYGILRFAIPLFPHAAREFCMTGMALGVIGILYGALVSVGQTDVKRLVAYTSISHMGFVLLGLFAWNEAGLLGAVLVMLAHGVSTGALFVLVGMLQDRMHTRDLRRMGGLWSTAPQLSGMTMLFAMASLGLPGLANFVGEFLVLLGTFQVNVPMAVLASLGLIASTAYSLWMIQYVFWGPNRSSWQLPDMNARETAVTVSLAAILFWLGLYPQPVIDTAGPSLDAARAGRTTMPALPGALRTGIAREPSVRRAKAEVTEGAILSERTPARGNAASASRNGEARP